MLELSLRWRSEREEGKGPEDRLGGVGSHMSKCMKLGPAGKMGVGIDWDRCRGCGKGREGGRGRGRGIVLDK